MTNRPNTQTDTERRLNAPCRSIMIDSPVNVNLRLGQMSHDNAQPILERTLRNT